MITEEDRQKALEHLGPKDPAVLYLPSYEKGLEMLAEVYARRRIRAAKLRARRARARERRRRDRGR